MTRLYVLAAFIVMTSAAFAQAPWPTKPVRVIVPSPPGGGTDTTGRFLAAQFTAALGTNFIVDNRGGASGVIGYQLAARSPADGYTLLVAPSSMTTVHLLTRDPGFDVVRDFAPITQVVEIPQVVVVHPTLAARTLQELR